MERNREQNAADSPRIVDASALLTAAKQLAQFVRSITPRAMRRSAARVGNYLTADMQGSIAFPSIELSLKTLRSLGFEPGFCVDVGAYRGEWTQLFKSIFPDTRVLMVEPQDGKRMILQGVAAEFGESVQYENALLAATDDQPVTFHEMETGSSVFEETSPYPRVDVQKTTRTLDTLLSLRPYPPIDMLKLDVQGSELEVLKGGTRALEKAHAVLLEASLVPVNAGCPPFSEVVGFLSNCGFRLFDFCSQVRRKDGVLWQTDLLFLRTDSPYAARPELTKDNWG
jgi:FkbM family methyltransferase